MSEDELLRDYTRVRHDGEVQVIEVGTVSWQGAHTPELSWVVAARLPADAGANDVQRARRKVLQRREFFVVCKDCGRREAIGHTDGVVCHGCMQKGGLVF